MNSTIREEQAGDAEQIAEVIACAFRNAPHTSHQEQFIVASLRESRTLALSLVAEVGGEIVGHVALSPVRISDGAANWYGLGPVAVVPAYQRQGLGSRLVEKALDAIEEKGAAGCVVLGEPGYYGRFGFKVEPGLILPEVPPEYFQALSFRGEPARGEVSFHAAFSAHG